MGTDAETGLSVSQRQDLRRIAGIMIPASAEFAVPGADDARIFADIEASLGRDVGEVLALSGFAAMEDRQAEAVAVRFLAAGDRAVTTLGRVVLQCYYRDDRVVRALGLEPRPPFPQGHVLEQGDWSLLDKVRVRAKMWRDAP
jgi:hypothetical protein